VQFRIRIHRPHPSRPGFPFSLHRQFATKTSLYLLKVTWKVVLEYIIYKIAPQRWVSNHGIHFRDTGFQVLICSICIPSSAQR
jgi:hypothetical protein